jgi:hypothetical protein
MPGQFGLGLKVSFHRLSTVSIEPGIDVGVQFVGRDRHFRRRHSILRRRGMCRAATHYDTAAGTRIP